VVLSLSGAEGDKKNSADQTDATDDRRKIDSLIFSMFDFQRTKLSVFLLGGPFDSTPGKANDADNDENDANNSSRFHAADPTTIAVPQSIAESE